MQQRWSYELPFARTWPFLAHRLPCRSLYGYFRQAPLGTLYAAMGQREQARAELSTAMELYRTMEMTFWLPQTEAALTQVEGR